MMPLNAHRLLAATKSLIPRGTLAGFIPCNIGDTQTRAFMLIDPKNGIALAFTFKGAQVFNFTREQLDRMRANRDVIDVHDVINQTN